MKAFDDTYVAMHLAQAQKLIFGPGEPKVTTIVLQLAQTEQMNAARERLQSLMSGPFQDADLEIRDVFELNPAYGQTISMVKALFAFVATMLVVIVLFTVSNTMTIAIMERTEEIGTLRAMGVQRKGIRWLFIAEGMLLGVVGWVAGVALALAIAWGLESFGIPWSPPGMAIEIPVTARFWNAPLLISLTCAGMVLVSMISAWLPARRAAHMNIVNALRHV
jgi:putative ABC transport system permease protein